jgi:hypothetical protein
MRLPSKFSTNSKLKLGTTSDLVIDVSDLLPTFCELAGTTPPLGVDGVSLAPTLTGIGRQRTRDYVIHEAGDNASIIRGRYKLIMNRGDKKKKDGKGKDKKKAAETTTQTGAALYDLVADPAEATDIATSKPELAAELEALLLAEHVTQPAGFANTYHHWTGANGADAAKADNWSDYIYQNAGETYTTDDGAPRDSWTALMENKGNSANGARVATDIQFLGLEIRGKTKAQELVVADGGRVTGRNEVRVAKQGILTIQDGAVASLRWIDILEGGILRGSGEVDASLFSAGATAVSGKLNVKGDYAERAGASLTLALSDKNSAQLLVQGDTALAGTLDIILSNGYKPSAGKRITLLAARSVKGTFANPDNLVVVGGTRFKIGYQNNAVTLTAE